VSDSNENSAAQFGRNETGSNGPIIPKSANEALRPERVPEPPKRSRKARSQVVIFLNFLMTVVVFVALAAAGAVYYAMHAYEKPGPLEANQNFIVRGGAGLIGEPAGIAHLRADAFRRMREFVCRLGKGGGGGLGGAAAIGQHIGAGADSGQGGRGRFGAAGHGGCRALELADQGAQLEFQQLQDVACRIGFHDRGDISGDSFLGGEYRRSLIGLLLAEQSKRHHQSHWMQSMRVFLHLEGKVMVKARQGGGIHLLDFETYF